MLDHWCWNLDFCLIGILCAAMDGRLGPILGMSCDPAPEPQYPRSPRTPHNSLTISTLQTRRRTKLDPVSTMSFQFYSYEASEHDFLPDTTGNQEHLDSVNQAPNGYSPDLDYKLPGMSSSPSDPPPPERQTPLQVPELTANPEVPYPRIFELLTQTHLHTLADSKSKPHYTHPRLQHDESPRTQGQPTPHDAQQPQAHNLQTQVPLITVSVAENLRSAPRKAREAELDEQIDEDEDPDDPADYKLKNKLAARKSRQRKKDEYAAAIQQLQGLRVWKDRAKGTLERAEGVTERLEAEKARREVEFLAVLNAPDEREKGSEEQLALAMRDIVGLKKMLGLTA